MGKKRYFKPEFCGECGTEIVATRETCPVCYSPVKKEVKLNDQK